MKPAVSKLSNDQIAADRREFDRLAAAGERARLARCSGSIPRNDAMGELRKRSADAVAIGGDHDRIVVGEAEAGELGRVRIEHDRGADILNLHGVHVHLSEIRRDLRAAIVSTSAAFAAAQTADEQVTQRAVIGAVVAAVMREHPTLAAKVRARLEHERYGAV